MDSSPVVESWGGVAWCGRWNSKDTGAPKDVRHKRISHRYEFLVMPWMQNIRAEIGYYCKLLCIYMLLCMPAVVDASNHSTPYPDSMEVASARANNA